MVATIDYFFKEILVDIFIYFWIVSAERHANNHGSLDGSDYRPYCVHSANYPSGDS